MAGRKALFWLLLVSNHLLLVPEAAQRCPDDCFTRVVFSCRCPNPNGKGSSCSWVGHGGTYVFPVCLDAIPTDFPRETQSIIIEHLSSSTLLEQSFQNLRIERLNHLNIRKSNVSAIQPRAFFGLSYLSHLYLADNRISRLDNETIEPYIISYMCPNLTHEEAECHSSMHQDDAQKNCAHPTQPQNPEIGAQPQSPENVLVSNPLYVPNIPKQAAYGLTCRRVSVVSSVAILCVMLITCCLSVGLYINTNIQNAQKLSNPIALTTWI
uniref:Uncharacterized protein n=1 Tax=Branchiostoma floridae TaxID=7739 RepID=C3YJN6_BRAFL|eukprot:XP_002603332.1 hypothetical protein BRAFLDRAFT_71375 [Branchiostoma floridae]